MRDSQMSRVTMREGQHSVKRLQKALSAVGHDGAEATSNNRRAGMTGRTARQVTPRKNVFDTLAHPDCVPCQYGPEVCKRIERGCSDGKNGNFKKGPF